MPTFSACEMMNAYWKKLNLTFESLGMGINLRQAMDQQQVSADVMSLIYE